MNNRVIVDTCVWASFFAKVNSAEKAAVDELLDADRVALVGPVLAEVLMGFRRKDQADWVASRLRMAHYIDPIWDDWVLAASLGRELASAGAKLPLTDLVLAAVARRCDAWIFTTDPHFDSVMGLKRYRPA